MAGGSVRKGKVSSESRAAMFVIKEHFMRKRKTAGRKSYDGERQKIKVNKVEYR
jgi:hypothetical protein